MPIHKITLAGLFFIVVSLGVYSCKYYIDHNFRQTYSDVNRAIHEEAGQAPFFKLHFNNGDVAILEEWRLNTAQDTITGQGQLYNFNRNQVNEGTLSFDLASIAIIETNRLEAVKSKDGGRIAALAILSGANVALGIYCLTNPKACFGSCPTFYLEGESYLHSAGAEGFSSAILPSLERRDIDALGHSTSSHAFSITMKNEALETHMVNEVLIHAVPKKKSERVFHDKYGAFYRCDKLFDCTSAVVGEKEIGPAIRSFDELEYFSPTDSFDLFSKEEIMLTFDDLPAGQLGVVLNFRQTLLTTFLLYTGLSYMGDEVGDYLSTLETSDQGKKYFERPFKKLGGIRLSVWNEASQTWRFIEEIHETGPIARNSMIAPLLESKAEAGALRIKVEMTKGLWRLDYVGLASIRAEAATHRIYPNKMEVIGGAPYSLGEIESDDDRYLISFPGDEFRFSFKLPEIEKEREWELFLSSKGYYLEWIRQEWLEGKDLLKLQKMILNDPQTWRELAKEFKSMEAEMEHVFWNSKYSRTQ